MFYQFGRNVWPNLTPGAVLGRTICYYPIPEVTGGYCQAGIANATCKTSRRNRDNHSRFEFFSYQLILKAYKIGLSFERC